MQAVTKARLQIHAAVVTWGFTSILGRLITLPALALVWWRVLFAVLALGALPRVWRGARSVRPRMALAYAGAGAVLALHWVAFFGAVKLANASVAATCIAIAPALVALVEPLIGRRRLDPRELLLGIGVCPGVALVVGGVPTGMHLGILVGVAAAVLVAVLAVLNKRLIGSTDALTVTWLELGGGLVFLTVLTPLGAHEGKVMPIPSGRDAILLAILAVVCTVLPTAACLAALRHLSAFRVQLTINLEPVYSIVLAIVLLGEEHELDVRFYAGVAIVLFAVFGHALLRRPAGSASGMPSR